MEIFSLFEVMGDSIPAVNQSNDCAIYSSMLAPTAKLRGVTHLCSHALKSQWIRAQLNLRLDLKKFFHQLLRSEMNHHQLPKYPFFVCKTGKEQISIQAGFSPPALQQIT